ncbi:hypothetical protein [Xanthobacter aminoxidans]|uniref:hypothetical protein n=1 Tax=Xanthobacter aminoxidans TaxID=186280 RepID=UPI0020231326|nr:hypothetical protein [Xanthobacter aminoxidans]MCL8381967.1 hypothetical protein [Xanthobacter aminoxidans]
MNAAMANRALDDMDAVMWPLIPGGRIPIEPLARAIQGSPTLNHFNLTNSQVGIINTGSIQKIDTAITQTQGSDAEGIGKIIQALTAVVLAAHELTADEQAKMVELIEALSQQVIEGRKPAVISALMKSLKDGLIGVSAAVPLVQKLWEALQALGS